MRTIKLILERDRSLELATATMDSRGKILYSGASEALRTVVQDALRGREDRVAAFDELAREGWSDGYTMIEIPERLEVLQP